MHRTRLVLVAAAAALVLTGCAAGPGATPIDGGDAGDGVDIRGEWGLVGGTHEGEALELSDFPLTMEFTNGSARVRTGCYSFDQPMTSDLQVVTIAYSNPTASCMALTESESAAIESLDTVTEFSRDGDTLTLAGDAVELSFELVPAVESENIVGTWLLGNITWGDVAAAFEAGPTITFAEDGSVSGSTGCNEFGGILDEVVSGTNRLTDLVTTDVACNSDEPTATMEADIRAVLEGGFLIHANDGQLQLISSTAETTLVYDPAA
jgi:heat shock protein HslJ